MERKITTFLAAYDELKNCVNDAVERRMTDREVEAQLGQALQRQVPGPRAQLPEIYYVRINFHNALPEPT